MKATAAIPINKNLDPAWVQSLTDRGTQKVYTGNELTTIGMPCGGIGAGQLYVRGDGTLAKWGIFNNTGGMGSNGNVSYSIAATRPPSSIDQGFSITTGATATRLDQTGFNAIQFVGEYPIATIKYVTTATPKPPVDVTLEVFSPFIPLNARESATPATIMHFSAANTTTAAVTAKITGWLKDTRVVLQLIQSPTSLKTSSTNDVDTTFSLAAGEKKDVVFVVAWNAGGNNNYANWYAGASDVAKFIAANYSRLSAQTHLFHDTYFNTTLPYWFVQRIGMPVSVLATGTSFWYKNGRFYAEEGVGCCDGTCTHVYNYAQAMAHLFPELERSVRTMQDLNPAVGLSANGLVGFRADTEYAADGQCGEVLKCYREHLMSADNTFLQANWTNIKKTMDYEITHDPDTNGIIEDGQWNTYDMKFNGPNTFVGSLYLAALRAASEMALLMNDTVDAARYNRIFTKGKVWTEQNLFTSTRNYFYNICPITGYAGYGTGCLSDQLFGQTWSHQLNLGYLYSKDMVRTSLQSVYNYEWAPDVSVVSPGPLRTFALPGEAGLIIVTWPFNDRQQAMGYGSEAWTGVEYQAATGMIYDSLLIQGLAVIRGIHDRYNGAKHNPWNEVECSEHYGRAMASWGALLAMSGITYDGPAGTLGFAPKMNQTDFRSFFSAAQGWGSIVQHRSGAGQENDIEVKYGSVSLKKLVFEVPSNIQGQSYVVKLNNTTIQASGAVVNGQFAVTLANRVTANAGDVLSFAIGNAVGVQKSTQPGTGTQVSVRVASGICSITCDLPGNTDLSVMLFNLRGQAVGTLFSRRLDKGLYDLHLDISGKNLHRGTGAYIIKISALEKVFYAGRVILH